MLEKEVAKKIQDWAIPQTWTTSPDLASATNYYNFIPNIDVKVQLILIQIKKCDFTVVLRRLALKTTQMSFNAWI